ncbi:arabinogalactan protein 12-like [Salvia hispanica]|uniref:arabinogalactan protein 12-like n=1 Tax=Salvia hispanica TaxID=49212 RepID=UPI0020099572|nr:arabinogalactan protein 12-like [Salvia hispanica]
MEGKKMKALGVALTIVALSAANGVAAAEAPAPSPTSDAALFVPTFLASLAAMAFAYIF